MVVEARPCQRDRAGDERRVAGGVGVRVAERQRDALGVGRRESGSPAKARQRVVVPQREESGAHLAAGFFGDDAEQGREAAAQALAPHREDGAAAIGQRATHRLQRGVGRWHVHEGERAQHDVHAAIAHVERVGAHPREGRVADTRPQGAASCRLDHSRGQIDADDMAGRAHGRRRRERHRTRAARDVEHA
ncbi:MAG TPA: hypothetical protein VN789_04350, partial [Casimicrobiaceae bacterium]|nr:hypothetical protein [Casimicrobiaceae bacterium]